MEDSVTILEVVFLEAEKVSLSKTHVIKVYIRDYVKSIQVFCI